MHKHASLMLLWAQDQVSNPTQVWQYKAEKFGWTDCPAHPRWHIYHEYRRKPAEEVPKPHVHAERMLMWADDQKNNPSQVWQYMHNKYKEFGWLECTKHPCWDASIMYRRKPPHPVLGPRGSPFHVELQKQWKPGQKWQFYDRYKESWRDVGEEPCWYESSIYRAKPVELGVRGWPHHKELQAEWKPTQQWQYMNPRNDRWEDLSAEPIWAEHTQYRQKPVEYHEEGRAEWAKDQIRNPEQVWEYYSGTYGRWKALSAEPDWLEHVQYRREPVVY